jgi:hypothetical protein
MCKINWEERVFQLASNLYASNEMTIDQAIANALIFKDTYIELMGLEEKKEEELAPKTKATKDEDFEFAWLLYRRKGSKKKSLEQWVKLSDEEKETAKGHIPAYIESVSDVKYQKDFERYLRDKCFNNIVFHKGLVIFDPNEEATKKKESDSKLIIGGEEYR